MEALVGYVYPQAGVPWEMDEATLAKWYVRAELLKNTGYLYNGAPMEPPEKPDYEAYLSSDLDAKLPT